MKKCVDCGDAPVFHRVTWIAAILDKTLTFSRVPFNGFLRGIESLCAGSLYNSVTPFVMKVLVAVRLAYFADAPDVHTSGRTRVMWEEALRRGISIRQFRLFGISRNAFLITRRGAYKTFLDLPRPGNVSSLGFAWMDDKEILRERLSAVDVPTARGGVVTSITQARALFGRLRPPVITKPEIGSRSRHTTTHIHTEEELIRGFKKAAVLSPWVIVEEEEIGFVYRGTVIGGKLVAVLRREPPMVIADGIHTVAELIESENKNPRRDGTIFHRIHIDDEARTELIRQELTLESVPPKEKIVAFSQKATRGIGGGTTDMTDAIHADNRVMLEAAAAVVNDPLIGIDFIIPDIAKSWREQERSGIIECNSMPFIDLHHYPLVGSPRNVAGALWDIVISDTGSIIV